MEELNLEIDQTQDVVIEIPDVNAATGDRILVQFFDNKINVFNFASESLKGKPGEITITPGVGYSFTVTDKLANQIEYDIVTYKIFKLNASYQATEIFFGSVDVEKADQDIAPLAIPYNNGNNEVTRSTNYGATHNDDIIFGVASGNIDITLPDPSLIRGKKIYCYNDTETGSMTIKYDDETLIILGQPNNSCLLYAAASTWKVFFTGVS